jgi:hypothetical protein
VIKPGQRGVAHRNEAAEEIYVLSGEGRVSLDGEVHDLRPMGTVRVATTSSLVTAQGSTAMDIVRFHSASIGEIGPAAESWRRTGSPAFTGLQPTDGR